VLAVAVERVEGDGLFHIWTARVFRRVADINRLGLFDAEVDEALFYLFLSASAQWCRDDVVQVVAVTRQTVSIDGDFDVRVLGATCRVTDGDPAVRFVSFLYFFCDGIPSATFRRSGDDVTRVIGVAGQTIGVNGDLHVRVRVATGCVADLDSFVVTNHLFAHVRRHLLGAALGRSGDDVVGVVAVTVQPVHVDGDLDKRVGGAVRCVADSDATVVLLLLELSYLLDCRATTTAIWGRDDVAFVIGVPSEAVNINGDFDVGIRLATGRMTDGDSFLSFNLLGDDLCFLLGFLYRAEITATGRGRNDVVAVVTVTIEAVKVDRNFDVRVG